MPQPTGSVNHSARTPQDPCPSPLATQGFTSEALDTKIAAAIINQQELITMISNGVAPAASPAPSEPTPPSEPEQVTTPAGGMSPKTIGIIAGATVGAGVPLLVGVSAAIWLSARRRAQNVSP